MIRLEEVSRILGRIVDESSYGSYERLDELPSHVIEDVKRVVEERMLPAVGYLHHLVPQDNFAVAREFIDDVVLGGQDIHQWRRGDVICSPDVWAEQALRMTISDFVDSLAQVPGERWFRQVLRPRHGASCRPGVLIRGLTYRWKSPQGLYGGVPGRIPVEEVSNLTLAFRRWLAAQVAFELEMGRPVPPPRFRERLLDRVTAGLSAAPELLSNDGRGALVGLLREVQELGLPGDDEAIGFRGEDAWYSADPHR